MQLTKIKAPGYWHRPASEAANTIADDLNCGDVKAVVAGDDVITNTSVDAGTLMGVYNVDIEPINQWDIDFFNERTQSCSTT